MKKILITLALFPALLFSAYNPFFSSQKIQKPKTEPLEKSQAAPKITPQKTQPTTKQNIQIAYFGFVESQKGEFALIGLKDKNIVIKKDDSFESGDNTYRVLKISSNSILLEDAQKRVQSVYFSSDMKKR